MKSVIKFDYATPIMRGKPGESFFIPTLRPQIYIPVTYSTAKDLGREVQVKCVTERYINGIRVWILK
jgi:hypothetical protein